MKIARVSVTGLSVFLLGLPAVSQGAPAKPVEVRERVFLADFSGIDEALARQGANVRLYSIDYSTIPESGQFGGTIFSRDVGNKQLEAHWVPGDPRRYGVDEIYWTTDQQDGSASVSMVDLNAAIDSAMNTWQAVPCSTIPLVKIPDFGYDFGYVQYLFGFGGSPGWLADITHAGWLPGAFFDAIAPGGSQYILGATFTFIWTNVWGIPTDIDSNRKTDVAFRETYYNDAFVWSVNAPSWNDPEVDVETIVLHETGHGLSQEHFGKMFVDASDPEPPYSLYHLHFAPRAVMNAVYWDTLRDLQGSDIGGHCSIWGSWPVK